MAVGDRKYFRKVESSDSPSRVGAKENISSSDAKFEPARMSDRTREGQANGKQFGDAHDFNSKAKVTNPGNGYNNTGKGAGAGFNSAEKDASIAYLKNRGEKGIVVNQFTGTHIVSRDHTNNVGVTAYNSKPIDQVYAPATSQGVPSPNQVTYKYVEKDIQSGKSAKK
jgi:hypothetical protein